MSEKLISTNLFIDDDLHPSKLLPRRAAQIQLKLDESDAYAARPKAKDLVP